MNRHRQTRLLLLVIAVALSIIALRPFIAPVTAHAVSGDALYIEPGTTMLRAPDGSRQVYGKVVVDLRTGKIWGFPTTTQAPYPVNSTQSKPPTSHPFLLGTFALDGMVE